MSIERRKVLVAFGAKLVLTPGRLGMKGAIEKAEELAASEPRRYVLMRQFENPANPAIHEKTTGPEIWDDTEGKVDLFVAGVGTGGTITGVSPLHQEDEGQGDPIDGGRAERVARHHADARRAALTPGPHKIRASAAGFIPKNLDMSLVDGVEQVTNEDAIPMARRLAREEGILCGISCGAAMVGGAAGRRRARVRGQDDRDGAARYGRTLSLGAALRRAVRRGEAMQARRPKGVSGRRRRTSSAASSRAMLESYRRDPRAPHGKPPLPALARRDRRDRRAAAAALLPRLLRPAGATTRTWVSTWARSSALRDKLERQIETCLCLAAEIGQGQPALHAGEARRVTPAFLERLPAKRAKLSSTTCRPPTTAIPPRRTSTK